MKSTNLTDPKSELARLNKELFEASKEGNVAKIQSLIAKNADVNALDPQEKMAPLHIAVYEDKVDAVKALINVEEANPDLDDEDRWTPLLIACLENRTEIARALISGRADVNIMEYDELGDGTQERCPIHLASHNGNVEIIKLLIENGAIVNNYGGYGVETPLIEAVKNGYAKAVKALIEVTDVNNDSTPLQVSLSLKSSNSEVIKTLLLGGVNLFKFKAIDNNLEKLIEALKSVTPSELKEIEDQSEKLEKIQKSGVYALLKIIDLQCDDEVLEEAKQNFEKQKQVFLNKVFVKQQPNTQKGDGGQSLANPTLGLQLDFLKLPLISKILNSKEFSAKNKFKIVEVIAELPTNDFKKFKKNIHLIKIFSSLPQANPADEDQSRALKLSLTTFLPEKIKNLFDRPSLITMVDIIQNRKSSTLVSDQRQTLFSQEQPSTLMQVLKGQKVADQGSKDMEMV